MSSHAVVRTHQEPALILWGCPEMEEAQTANDLLEWHPQLWSTPAALPWLEARNLKPDEWISSEKEKIMNPVEWAMQTLATSPASAANLVLGVGFDPDFLMNSLEACPLSLALWCRGYRYFRASPPEVRLWLHPGGELSIWKGREWNHQTIDHEGFITIQMARPAAVRYRPFARPHRM